MSAPIIIPFNFQPVSIDFKNNASYTVPSGKYARVTIGITCNAFVTSISGATKTQNSLSNGNISKDFSIFVKGGDIVSSSKTNASGASGAYTVTNSFSECVISVNSNVINRTRSYVSGISSESVTVSGYTDVSFHIEEYSAIS